MKEKYDEKMLEFNMVYNTEFSSWRELENAENWGKETDSENQTEMTDNNIFGKLCINKYYEVAAAAFRELDKNHLFFGDKINADLQNPDEMKLVVK